MIIDGPSGAYWDSGDEVAALPDGEVLIVSASYSELYNPARNVWSGRVPLAAEQENSATVQLADGRILIAGGTHETYEPYPGWFMDPVITAQAQLHDPQRNSWKLAAPMHSPRFTNTTPCLFGVPLRNGDALVGSGVNARYQPTNTSEEYNPNSNKWTLVASLPIAPEDAVALPDGRVFAFGDSGGELYGPRLRYLQHASMFPELLDTGALSFAPCGALHFATSTSPAAILPIGRSRRAHQHPNWSAQRAEPATA